MRVMGGCDWNRPVRMRCKPPRWTASFLRVLAGSAPGKSMTMRSGPVTAWVAGDTGPLVLTSIWGCPEEPRTETLRTVRLWPRAAGARRARAASLMPVAFRFAVFIVVSKLLLDSSSVTGVVTHSVELLRYTKGHGRFGGWRSRWFLAQGLKPLFLPRFLQRLALRRPATTAGHSVFGRDDLHTEIQLLTRSRGHGSPKKRKSCPEHGAKVRDSPLFLAKGVKNREK